ncbi:hypothetical protein [Amycolatopsis sp. FDAARGOS 1241]|uniref:hypothetical protein n=1 Tax=Amycolatopsis sp. FDAARGOS 1241 TaxID=2778070 RepID=UPI00194DB665|nr:hypothetical protein [Amycolatopsis sp. FDAARGOS 1241]QRP48622.1 hypothetical protein I6J71_12730 [Amycolatopsis sp. FDAARGOS 1241]
MTDMVTGRKLVAIGGCGDKSKEAVGDAVTCGGAAGLFGGDGKGTDVRRSFEDERFEKFIRAWLELLDTDRNLLANART